jgi:hypothetical protein
MATEGHNEETSVMRLQGDFHLAPQQGGQEPTANGAATY